MARKIGRREFFRTGAQAGLTLALARRLAASPGRPVKAVDVAGLNIYDVLAHKRLVFSRRAFEAVLEKLK